MSRNWCKRYAVDSIQEIVFERSTFPAQAARGRSLTAGKNARCAAARGSGIADVARVEKRCGNDELSASCECRTQHRGTIFSREAAKGAGCERCARSSVHGH